MVSRNFGSKIMLIKKNSIRPWKLWVKRFICVKKYWSQNYFLSNICCCCCCCCCVVVQQRLHFSFRGEVQISCQYQPQLSCGWFETILKSIVDCEIYFFREEVEEFFDFMDRDFDGRLTFEEFMGEESTIEKLFKNMDKNGDGYVTKQVIMLTKWMVSDWNEY